MESNEQAELTRKMGADSQTESRTTAKGREGRDGRIERKGKRTQGQQCADWRGAEEGIRGLNVMKKYN